MQEPRPLDDASLDHELQAMLAVDPSPDFLARVRISVSTARPSVRFSYGWMVTAVATTAAAIIVGVLVSRPNVSERVDQDPPMTGDSRHSIELPTPVSPPISPPSVRARSPQLRNSAPREPRVEVLISADDASAFDELVKSVAERRFEVIPNDGLLPDDAVMTNIAVSPIVFEPVQVNAIDKGAFQ